MPPPAQYTPPVDAWYKFLSGNFFRGTRRGQINSVHKTRLDRPEKVAEFRHAVAHGVLDLGPELTKQQASKLVDMNIPIPSGVRISVTRAKRTPSA